MSRSKTKKRRWWLPSSHKKHSPQFKILRNFPNEATRSTYDTANQTSQHLSLFFHPCNLPFLFVFLLGFALLVLFLLSLLCCPSFLQMHLHRRHKEEQSRKEKALNTNSRGRTSKIFTFCQRRRKKKTRNHKERRIRCCTKTINKPLQQVDKFSLYSFEFGKGKRAKQGS